MSVFPLDVHSFAGGQVNFDGFWIDGRHPSSVSQKTELVVVYRSFVDVRKSMGGVFGGRLSLVDEPGQTKYLAAQTLNDKRSKLGCAEGRRPKRIPNSNNT